MRMLEKIRKMKKSDARSWKYENVGDCFAGEVMSPLRAVETTFGGSWAIDVKSEEDGEIYTVWAGTVIEKELRRQGVEVGDQVGFKFLGQKKNYKDFIVHVEKRGKPTKDSPLNGESRDTDKEAPGANEDIPF